MIGIQPTGFLTVIIIGIALSMDAFSLGVGLGAQGMRWRDVVRLSLVISALHVILPLSGIWIGKWLHGIFGDIFQRLAALILMILGSKMALESIRRKVDEKLPPLQANLRIADDELPPLQSNLFQLSFFALGVSVDALSVGFSLGTLGVSPLFSSIAFGLLSGMLSLAGLYVGRKVNQALGEYGQLAGGAVLVALGLKIFF
ncbi:manganese efflux pump MntP family protein [Ferroacidibacillus organovorans]|uniref:Manganese efflux pump MntP n=1 Tax=Ferroacidibacillus organovorans TaxID=1765683 RepID=A0A101XPY4_9BACL|nr:manganese efflux pump [Ferroacidibacillus organovorans]KUO95276.1 hypothetical protein ATW55_14180 [Ferroacidibacillus organovorans]